jgi:uncharacterized protein (TIGR02757 family)
MNTNIHNIAFHEIKELLDRHVSRINVPKFADSDPVKFPRRYTLLQDVEVAGVLSAINAWGRRDMILRDLERLFAMMGVSPYDFVMSSKPDDLQGNKAIHRTFNISDLGFICKGLRAIYSRQNSLEDFFIDKDMFDGIRDLRRTIIVANCGESATHRSSKHLSDPESKSACKRLHLFLRWLVRRDGIVDLGLWKRLSPAALYIPLDVHVGRVARSLGLITRNQNDRTTVEQLTAELVKMNPDDPVRYDFGLFGIGEQKIEL